MRVQERDMGRDERTILAGMVADKSVVSRVKSKWPPTGLFSSRWANLVGNWAVDYWDKYKRPLGKTVETMFDQWASRDNRDEPTVKLVEQFLVAMSDERAKGKPPAADYVVDLAARHFNLVRARDLVDQLSSAVEAKDVDAAASLIENHRKIEMGSCGWVDPFHDPAVVAAAFDTFRDPVIKYPGALGEFFQDALERDGLVSVMAPEKRGKSYWLMDLVWRALQQGRRVAYFECGDMSQTQVIRRLSARAARRPLRACDVQHPTALTVEGKSVIVNHEIKRYDTPMDKRKALAGFERTAGKLGPDCLFRLACHSNHTLTVSAAAASVHDWEAQGWVADVVLFDYADLLAPPVGVQEPRERINENWMGLRRLSQDLHCLVLVATQAKASSYTAETLTMEHFADDKRKFAHVTGSFGINQDVKEKKKGVFRLNWLCLRDNEFSTENVVYTAANLAIANPAVLSSW